MRGEIVFDLFPPDAACAPSVRDGNANLKHHGVIRTFVVFAATIPANRNGDLAKLAGLQRDRGQLCDLEGGVRAERHLEGRRPFALTAHAAGEHKTAQLSAFDDGVFPGKRKAAVGAAGDDERMFKSRKNASVIV